MKNIPHQHNWVSSCPGGTMRSTLTLALSICFGLSVNAQLPATGSGTVASVVRRAAQSVVLIRTFDQQGQTVGGGGSRTSCNFPRTVQNALGAIVAGVGSR